MISKQQVQIHLESMPKNFTLDDFIEKLILVEKIKKGIQDMESNNVLTEEELELEIKNMVKITWSVQSKD